MTYYAVRYGPNGQPRSVAVSLPWVSIIADERHYQPQAKPAPIERGPAMTDRVIRKALARDRKQAAQALNQLSFELTLRRIIREGA